MEGSEENAQNKVLEEFLSFYTCSDADLAHKLSEEELKTLCTKVKCRVLMDRWNPVEDISRKLRCQGRLQNKSLRSANRFIAKVFNHYRPFYLYKDEQILEVQREEYRDRKKLNLLRLELWEYNQKMQDAANSNAKDKDIVFVSQLMSQDTQDINANNLEDSLAKPLNSQQYDNNIYNNFLDINTESMIIPMQSQCTEDLVFTQDSQYAQFNRSVPCTSTQENLVS